MVVTHNNHYTTEHIQATPLTVYTFLPGIGSEQICPIRTCPKLIPWYVLQVNLQRFSKVSGYSHNLTERYGEVYLFQG
jgi:hypothetical protein